MKDEPLVSVVIPTHNRREKLKRLLNSVLKSSYRNIEIIVIDDASTDGTYEEVKERYPSVKIFRNKKERLLAGSRNIGILKSTGDLIFLIDDDNVITKETLNELVRMMNKDATVGVAGPVMYYLGDPSRVWCGGVKINYVTSRTFFLEWNKRHVNFDQILESDTFPNAFMIRRSVVDKVGLFDEVNFKIHYDEADFCNRVRQAGFRIVLCPTAKVWHDIPLPEEVKDRCRLLGCNNALRAYYCGRNRIIFHRKYSKWWQFLIFILVFNWLFMLYYLRVILLDFQKSVKERLTIGKSYLKGVWKGLVWR